MTVKVANAGSNSTGPLARGRGWGGNLGENGARHDGSSMLFDAAGRRLASGAVLAPLGQSPLTGL